MSDIPPRAPDVILLAEDEGEVRRFLAKLLGGAGYQVLEAANGALALAAAQAHAGPIHLLVTDVVMPVMTGTELARHFLVARPQARVLFISGYSDPAAIAEIQTLAGAEYLGKPFSPRDLLSRVRVLLG
ncbi:MAG TPA: response regulator [Terriglobales bacterium]